MISFLQNGTFVKGTFDINEYSDFDEFVDEDDEDWGDWKKSEVLKISDCDELDLTLERDIQDLLIDFDDGDDKQTILMVDNIKKLTLKSFILEEPDAGRVS